ncbi:hypothetical protein GCM10009624_11330 [Gordonia sinesedis]
MADPDRYTVDVVRAWRFDSARTVISAMRTKSATITDHANATARDYDASTDFWKGYGGEAARNLSAMHRDDLVRSAAVVMRVAETAGDVLDQIQGYVDVLNNTVTDINDSEFDLAYRSDGGVYSRKSNAQWSDEWGWRASYKLVQKEAAENDFTAKLRTILAHVESVDQAGGESVRSFLEKLTDGVKEGAVPRPEDPRLQDILNRYQVSKSGGQASLWPDGTTLALIRRFVPGFKASLMTPEEATMLKSLLSSGGAFALKNFYDARSLADQVAKSRFPEKSQNDGHGDAFRHAYWNALMTREFGEAWTNSYATAHERLGGNPANREAMDLYNNEIGRKVARTNPNASPDELADLVAKEVKEGRTVVITDPGRSIDWSNRVPVDATGQPGSVGIPLPVGN